MVAGTEPLAPLTGWRDELADTVVVSSRLADRFWDVWERIRTACKQHDIPVREIRAANIWVRDYFPLQVGSEFVQFKYSASGYGGFDRFPVLCRTGKADWPVQASATSPIALDNGGNCVRYDDRAIITDVVFKHNPSVERKKLTRQLESLLQSQVVVIPREPGDEMGHADGIVRFVDQKTVLINNYLSMGQKQYDRYFGRLYALLTRTGLTVLPFPYAYCHCPIMTERRFREQYPDADDFNPGFGYYINFLQASRLILVPSFGLPEDEQAVEALRSAFPFTTVTSVDCRRLSMYGGLLNCVTGTYTEARPMTVDEVLQGLRDHPNGNYTTERMPQRDAERLVEQLSRHGIFAVTTAPFNHTFCRVEVIRPRGH